MTIDYAAAAEDMKQMTDSQLSEIGQLGAQLVQAMQQVEATEKTLTLQKELVAMLTKTTIPEKLAAFGLDKVTLKSGHEIEVKQFYAAHISEEKRSAAHTWLREHGFGSLIKNEIVIEMLPGEDKQSQLIKEYLEEQGIHAVCREAVNPATLKKFVKDQMETPEEDHPVKPPTDIFGIFQGKIATVKNKKGK